MPSRLSVVAVLFLLLNFFPTQKGWSQKFSLGVKAGPSVTLGRFRDSDLRDIYTTKPVFGYMVGGLVIFPLEKDYSFISEIGYSQKGKKVLFNDNTWTNKTTFNFIDISMALRKSYEFRLRDNIKSKIFFNIGPSIEYWLNGKGVIEAGGPSAEYTIVFNQVAEGGNFNTNYYNDINRWLFGINLSVGADAPITSTQRIYTELRFSLGQTNLGKKDSSSSIDILGFQDDLKMNLKTIILSVAYTFEFDLKESKMGKSTKDKMIKRKRIKR
ncbi:MAG: porin family protein [Cyclobacteriaceae bacterium]